MASWDRESLLRLGRGFMEPRILLTAIELDLFAMLEAGPLSSEEVARKRGADGRAMRILLDALAAMALLSKEGERYAVEAEVASLLVPSSASSVAPMLEHAANLWRTWSHLTEVVHSGLPAPVEEDAVPDRNYEAFIGGMHVVGSALAERVVSNLDLEGVRRILDVGGGSGVYTMALLRAAPEARGTIFDRPPVVEISRRFLSLAGMLDRVDLVAGDYNGDELPGGHDLVLLSAIIHQNSPEQNKALFGRCFRALVPGGRIVIRDHVMSPDRLQPRSGAIFAVNMLVGTDGGDTYTLDEVWKELEAVGFGDVRGRAGGETMDGLIEARRP